MRVLLKNLSISGNDVFTVICSIVNASASDDWGSVDGISFMDGSSGTTPVCSLFTFASRVAEKGMSTEESLVFVARTSRDNGSGLVSSVELYGLNLIISWYRVSSSGGAITANVEGLQAVFDSLLAQKNIGKKSTRHQPTATHSPFAKPNR